MWKPVTFIQTFQNDDFINFINFIDFIDFFNCTLKNELWMEL